MSDTPIEILELKKTYKDKRRREIQALKGISLNVRQGNVVGFLGPNGAGKSTTIKNLIGLIRPTAGHIKLFGLPVSDPVSRSRIGYLPENPAFYDFLNAYEYLSLVGKFFNMDAKSIRSASDSVLELLNLSGAAKRPIRGFSKGMVQRLGIAQTLLHDPDLYILDEPMSGLDPLGRAMVKDIIRDLKVRGKTVFFSTHVTADIEAVCDKVAILINGRLKAFDSVQELLEQGIEGYLVQLSCCNQLMLDGFNVLERPGEVLEVEVPLAELTRFVELVTDVGGTIQRMDPRRRDLEKFFLDIVKQEDLAR